MKNDSYHKAQEKARKKRVKKRTDSEEIMTKLCPRGKASAKRKFKVYP